MASTNSLEKADPVAAPPPTAVIEQISLPDVGEVGVSEGSNIGGPNRLLQSEQGHRQPSNFLETSDSIASPTKLSKLNAPVPLAPPNGLCDSEENDSSHSIFIYRHLVLINRKSGYRV